MAQNFVGFIGALERQLQASKVSDYTTVLQEGQA